MAKTGPFVYFSLKIEKNTLNINLFGEGFRRKCLFYIFVFFFSKLACIAGNYRPCDLNMPKTVPRRSDNHYDYAKDAPLTALGNFQAFLTGKMKQNLKKLWPALSWCISVYSSCLC